MTQTAQELWAQCCLFIKDIITPVQYDTWFRDISCMEYNVAVRKLILMVPGSFFADQLEERFQPVVRAAVKKVFGEGVQIFYGYRTVGSDPSTANIQKSSAPSATILAQSKSLPQRQQ